MPSSIQDFTSQAPNDEIAFLQSLDLTAVEIIDDSDDDDVLDLTGEPAVDNNQGNDQSGTLKTDVDSEALEFLQGAGLSDEALRSMGIDIEEIHAQRRMHKQMQQDLEYARRIQDQLNSEASSSTATPSTLPPRQFPFPLPQQSSIHPQQNTSFPPHQPLPLTIDRPAGPAEDRSPKRLKTDNDDIIDLVNNQFQRSGIYSTPIGSYASAPSSSSSSSNKNNNNNSSIDRPAILIDDDDDDDIIDLTDDANFGSSSRPITLNSTGVNNVVSSSASSSGSSSMPRPPALSPSPFYSSCTQSQDLFRHRLDLDVDPYGINRSSMIRSLMGEINQAARAAGSYTPYFMATSIGSSRRTYSRLDLPYAQYAAEYTPPLTGEQTEKELKQLLESIQYEDSITPESRIGTPDGLGVTLMEHQKVGLQWMTRQEESVNKGGILSDDMGLGKTIQAMAIIVSRPCENPTTLPQHQLTRSRAQKLKLKATLVVCPVSLIAQWEREIVTKTNPSLKVYVYHGPFRKCDPISFIKYDVIVTAFTTVAADHHELEERSGPLAKVKFHRIILDEAHTIKNRRTRAAIACCRMDADYRWCLTATPIQNKIEELYSLIHFLRIRPYSEWDKFRDEIEKPMKKGKHTHALKKVQVLLKAISLRRSKKAKIDGKPILQLPERKVNFTHVNFTPDERRFYDYVNANAQERFNRLVEAGTVMRNYSSVLVLLLRLRQACLHQSLTMIEAPNEDGSTEDRSIVAKAMDKRVVERLLVSDNLKEIECPICMDMADQAQIIANCGHILCRECLTNYINTGDGSDKRCPHCRGPLDRKKVVPVETFLLIHAPEVYVEVVGALPEKKENEIEKPVNKFQSSSKLDKMVEILSETRRTTNNEDKTIIFSQFTSMLDLVEGSLRQNDFKFERFDGTMTVTKREASLARFFTDPNVTVLLVSTKCGSLGLNLTVANRVILLDIWWNPALENQAIDRVHRIGQKKPVDVHRIFVNDTVEDRILELQNKKQALIDGSLGEGNATKVGRLGFQELLHLFRGTGIPNQNESSAGSSV